MTDHNDVPAVTTYMADAGGRRTSGFHLRHCNVLVTPTDAEHNEKAFALACAMARVNQTQQLLNEAVDKLEDARRETALLTDEKNGRATIRLLGPGYVRMINGELWLLNRRERGFGEFGFWLENWDTLFRRYGVLVTDHGVDEHGPWFKVEAKA